MSLPVVILKPRKARPFHARHPWLFANSIARIEGEPIPGAEVAVQSHDGAFIARGLFNPKSAIQTRLYRWEDAPLDAAFWRERIAAALRFRRDVLGWDQPGGACRLIYSESDGLSGLVVDRYDRWLVAQFTSLALFTIRPMLLEILMEQTGAEGILLRTERGIAALEGLRLEPQTEAAIGTLPPGPLEITENDLHYEVDPRAGQKTGFYLDQRENRRAAAPLSKGRRVLDLFCYSGGFALNALKHGSSHVLGIDSSAPAIELARRNAIRNQLGHARFETADVFDVLERLAQAGERFGMIICDPPKFTRGPKVVGEALKGYLKLNQAAVRLLEPGGILVTCSCSGHVDRTQFAQTLGHVAESTQRPIALFEMRGQAADHPVSTSCLQTEYLKCAFAHVG